MSQIYNGTFVLGNTSASTLSAQPGIKLDTSVPGVIGIGTDETVLWSGSLETIGSSATLSEPITNFDTIKLYYRDHNGNINGISELPTNYWPDFPGINETFMNQAGTMCIRTLRFTTNSNKDVINIAGAIQFNVSTNAISNYSHVTANNADCLIFIKEIHGINRISGNA